MPIGHIEYVLPPGQINRNAYQLEYYHKNKEIISLRRKQIYREKHPKRDVKQKNL